jgi:hypothetical protein
MVNASRRFGADINFTIFSTRGHNSWDSAYQNDSLYEWLLSHKKNGYTEKSVSISLLPYAGVFTGPDGDTVRITASNNQLIAFPGKDTVHLKTAGENLFFIRPDRDVDIRFNMQNGTVQSFWCLGERKLLYRKINR